MIIIFVIILVTDLAEDDVLAIQPLGLGGAEEELRPVGVGSSVGHGQDTCEKRSIIQKKFIVGKCSRTAMGDIGGI